MKRSTVILLLSTTTIAGLVVWRVASPPPPTEVVVAAAERVAELRAIVRATGEIRAKEFVDIQAEVAGLITDLLVREGDQVREGDVLLRLDDLQLRADVDAARAEVGAAEADAKNAEAGIAFALANLATREVALASSRFERERAVISHERAESSFRRKKELFESELIGNEEYEIAAADARLAAQQVELQDARIRQAQAELEATATQVEAARATHERFLQQISAARARLLRAEDLAAKAVLRAPLSGLITACNVEKGERAVPGIQSNPIATLMTIANMSIIEAEIKVDEADIVAVLLEADAFVEVDALRGVEIRGTVTEIGQSPIQAADNQQGKEFKVVVRLIDPPGALRPGFTATAEIVTGVRRDCLVVPLQALTAREVEVDAAGRYRPPPQPVDGDTLVDGVRAASARQRRKEFEGVFVVEDGRARFRPITTGIAGDIDIEVESGLEPGEQVVIGPFQALRKLAEWDRVRIDRQRQVSIDALRRR